MIEIKNLKFKYNQDQTSYTLNDVSFHVKHGEWLSIVGHNGSGKSTTARLIGGLLVADSGQIIVDGQELTEETVWDIRDKIGMVFQNPDNQFVGATVEDDVAFGLENKGLPYKEMVSRVQEALSFVGMMDFKDREPARLSGGQKQRVAIAGIIAMRPSILILDEATSMLDPEGRGGRNMNDRNLKLIYIALGSLMLILLQSDVFQLAISLINILPIPYLTETIYWLMRILSFVGVVIFIIISLKLILNNIKKL